MVWRKLRPARQLAGNLWQLSYVMRYCLVWLGGKFADSFCTVPFTVQPFAYTSCTSRLRAPQGSHRMGDQWHQLWPEPISLRYPKYLSWYTRVSVRLLLTFNTYKYWSPPFTPRVWEGCTVPFTVQPFAYTSCTSRLRAPRGSHRMGDQWHQLWPEPISLRYPKYLSWYTRVGVRLLLN